VIVNPEILMGNDNIEKLWKKPHVTKRIMSIIFDEGHCISTWNKFRNQYQRVGDLRYLIPEKVPFYVVSATLPPAVLLDIVEILKLRPKETVHIIYSNDRPEIRLSVRGLVCAASSFQDLAFLIPPNYQEGDPPILPFLVFFDDTKEAERACKYLCTLLPRSLWHKIRWFHSTMTHHFREAQVEAVKAGDVWGLCCTDAFGMVGLLCANLKTQHAHNRTGHGHIQHRSCCPVESDL
jgi:ATP-dependent DNA helicase RecQ